MLKKTLFLVGTLLALIGGAYVLAPEFLLAHTGEFILDMNADIDVRATYGGIQLALGVLLVVYALRGQHVVFLMQLVAWTLFVVGGVRCFAYLWFSPSIPLHLWIGSAEVVVAIVLFALTHNAPED